jgi:O-antigen ligase
VFQASAADLSHEEGRRAMWLESHNSYTQVSSETGIPGLIFFGGAVLSSVVGLLKIRRTVSTKAQERRSVINCLLVGFFAFAFTCFFSSVAYQFYFALMIGLCAGILTAARNQAVAR